MQLRAEVELGKPLNALRLYLENDWIRKVAGTLNVYDFSQPAIDVEQTEDLNFVEFMNNEVKIALNVNSTWSFFNSSVMVAVSDFMGNVTDIGMSIKIVHQFYFHYLIFFIIFLIFYFSQLKN